MSEHLPYEQQLPHQWDALPLPDINLAWADMKRRLEEDDDRKPVAWWNRGCLLWGVMLLGLLGAGWWLFRPDKWFTNKKEAATISINKEPGIKEQKTDTAQLINRDQDTDTAVSKGPVETYSTNDTITQVKKTKSIKADAPTQVAIKENGNNITNPKKQTTRKNRDPKSPIRNEKKQTMDTKGKGEEITGKKKTIDRTEAPDSSSNKKPQVANDRPKDSITQAITKIDTTSKKEPQADTVVTKSNPQKDSAKKKPLFFSAGIAIHQQIPVAGQSLTPYNALGRKGSLADYIPSVYVRLNRKDRWFLQAEFRYGAPQNTKKFVYSQESVLDTGQSPVFNTITSTTLQKTFYHQLPLTFNYFVRPGWSIGGGIQWNKFMSAIAEVDVNKKRIATGQDSIISKFIRRDYGDSGWRFSKSYFLGVLETEYQRKRFSIGARYTFGLQPYIKFNLRSGNPQQQKSTTLQVFLRYELWKSKQD